MKLCKYEIVGILFTFSVPAYSREAFKLAPRWHTLSSSLYQILQQTAVAFNNYCVYNAASVGKRRDCFFFRSMSNCFQANVVIVDTGEHSFSIGLFYCIILNKVKKVRLVL